MNENRQPQGPGRSEEGAKEQLLLWLRRLVAFGWYALFLLVAILIGRWALFPAGKEVPRGVGFAWLIALVILLVAFVACHLAARLWMLALRDRAVPPPAPPPPEEEAPETRPRREAFPSPASVAVGVWLLAFIALVLGGLFLALSPPHGIVELFPAATRNGLQELIVSMLAGGMGASISAMRGYLQHASIRKDFDLAYVPWYVARLLMGLLLGGIFYFVVRGGLLAAGGGQALDFNLYGLAGLGALVGLFSKNAVDKLREIFGNLFQTEEELGRELLQRLPDDLQEKVAPYLAQSGSQRARQKLLDALPEELRKKVEDHLAQARSDERPARETDEEPEGGRGDGG